MLTRNEQIFKWSLYTAAALLCAAFQGIVLQRITLLGVMPFVYPLLAAIPGTYERPASAAAFALGVGVLCDWLLPGGLPFFYTLVFPVAGLAASLAGQGLLPAGFLCSLAVSAFAFAFHGAARCVLLWATGRPAWTAGAFAALREFLVTAPLILPVTVLFSAVAERVHMND